MIAQVFGRYATGAIEFNEVVCSQNIAGKNGGCFLSAGRGIVTNGTTMQDNVADNGGCICEFGSRCLYWFDRDQCEGHRNPEASGLYARRTLHKPLAITCSMYVVAEKGSCCTLVDGIKTEC